MLSNLFVYIVRIFDEFVFIKVISHQFYNYIVYDFVIKNVLIIGR